MSSPQIGNVEHYPLVCLDIDGVCGPIGQNPRFHCHGSPPGFVDCGNSVQAHPAASRWLTELEAAFASVCWISSWAGNSRGFAAGLGLPSAFDWTYIDTRSEWNAKTSIGRKPAGLARVIHPTAPVAVVDDHLSAQFPVRHNKISPPEERRYRESHYGCCSEEEQEINDFLRRPGPTLLVAPASAVGLTRNLIDVLCRFAHDPESPVFATRRVYEADVDWWVQWPAPLDSAIENPIRIEPDDPDSWLEVRLANIKIWKVNQRGSTIE